MTHQPPPAPAVAARRRPFFTAWQLALIGCTAAAVLGGLAWFAAHVKGKKSGQPPVVQTNGDREGGPTPPGGSAAPKTQPDPTKKNADDKAALPTDRETVEGLRSALGTLTGVGIRQAYLNIGLLADGVENEVYEVADAVRVLDTVLTFVATVDKQLAGLPAGAFEAEDRETVALARRVLRLLRTQSNELFNYWEDGSKEAATRFQMARSESWEAIKELLDLDD